VIKDKNLLTIGNIKWLSLNPVFNNYSKIVFFSNISVKESTFFKKLMKKEEMKPILYKYFTNFNFKNVI